MALTYLTKKYYLYANNTLNKAIKSYKKYTSHTIKCLTIFMSAFCHTHVENLLKGPAKGLSKIRQIDFLHMTGYWDNFSIFSNSCLRGKCGLGSLMVAAKKTWS